MVHGHVLQERRHQYCAGARSQAHTHGAGRTLAQLAPPVTQLVGFSHQGARPSQHLAAEGCEFAVAADAVEQGYAQLLLQRAHAAAEGGLCQMHGLGRAAERAGLRHRYEMPELHQRHDFSRPEVCMKLMLMQPTMHWTFDGRSEEHTSELQSQSNLVCRLLLEKKNNTIDLRMSVSNPIQYRLKSIVNSLRKTSTIDEPTSQATAEAGSFGQRRRRPP